MYLALTTSDWILNKRISQEAGFFVAPGWRYDLEEKIEADYGIYDPSEVGKTYVLSGKYGKVTVKIVSLGESFDWKIDVTVENTGGDLGGYDSTSWWDVVGMNIITYEKSFSLTVPNDAGVSFDFSTKMKRLIYSKIEKIVWGVQEYETFHYQLAYPNKPFRLYHVIPKFAGYQFLHWKDWLGHTYAPGQEVEFDPDTLLYGLKPVMRKYTYLPVRAKDTGALLRGENGLILRDGD
jgi:hypothetical protein